MTSKKDRKERRNRGDCEGRKWHGREQTRKKPCMQSGPAAMLCTLEAGHKGPHEATDGLQVLDTWEDGWDDL